MKYFLKPDIIGVDAIQMPQITVPIEFQKDEWLLIDPTGLMFKRSDKEFKEEYGQECNIDR